MGIELRWVLDSRDQEFPPGRLADAKRGDTSDPGYPQPQAAEVESARLLANDASPALLAEGSRTRTWTGWPTTSSPRTAVRRPNPSSTGPPGCTTPREARGDQMSTSRVFGYAAAGWCLGPAGVSAWLVAAGPIGQPQADRRYAAYASGLAIMSVLVLVLKLAGAAVALAAVLVQPGGRRWPRQLLGVALWGVFGLLSLYSAGNLAITVGTLSGLLARRPPGPPPAA
jgi:hypothetical protein